MAGSMDDTLQPSLLYAYWAAPEKYRWDSLNALRKRSSAGRSGKETAKDDSKAFAAQR
jgi:hypothetical protein